jgi:hypothetical protein
MSTQKDGERYSSVQYHALSIPTEDDSTSQVHVQRRVVSYPIGQNHVVQWNQANFSGQEITIPVSEIPELVGELTQFLLSKAQRPNTEPIPESESPTDKILARQLTLCGNAVSGLGEEGLAKQLWRLAGKLRRR